MSTFFNDLFDPPRFRHLPFRERQKISLFVRGNLSGSFFCGFFMIVSIAVGIHKMAYLTAFNFVVLLTSVYFARRGYFHIAKHLSLNSAVILFVGANYFYGTVARTEIYLYTFPAIIVFMFDDKRTVLAYCAYLLGAFMLCLYLQKHFDGNYDGDVTTLAKFTYLNYVFGFFMLSLIIYSFKSENVENSIKIETQKVAIEEKNREITASINYAKRIQDSLLTPRALLDKSMPQHFLFYSPKDIVSGDFYWMQAISDTEVIFAVGDCTGHGVPGALVSSICMNRLNSALEKTTSPGQILENANKAIKFNLNQIGNENIRDGMDIIICYLNTESRKVIYSGANRPLWILKNNKPALESLVEVKPDKVSIGGFTESTQQFSEKEITLEPGDTLYLFTDGFADQFGGTEGKKLTTKRFKEMIASHNHMPIKEIGDKLGENYTNWKGKHEQIDDVTVLAVRV